MHWLGRSLAQVSFRHAAFNVPLDQIAGSIKAYLRDGDSRDALPSWND
jgi:hypothetical protein